MTRIIDLPENDLLIVDNVIRSLYTCTYDYQSVTRTERSDYPYDILEAVELLNGLDGSHDDTGFLLFHARVYAIADRHIVEYLKSEAIKLYERALKEDFDTGDFVASLKYLYENLPESEALLKAAASKQLAEEVEN